MKKKKITLLAAVLATAAMFTGCTIENEYVPVDTEVQVMETNDMEAVSYQLADEDTYNKTVLANSEIAADFDDWYGDINAKVLCILL